MYAQRDRLEHDVAPGDVLVVEACRDLERLGVHRPVAQPLQRALYGRRGLLDLFVGGIRQQLCEDAGAQSLDEIALAPGAHGDAGIELYAPRIFPAADQLFERAFQ